MRIVLAHLSRGVDFTPASPAVDHLGIASIAGQLLARKHEVLQVDSGLQGLDEDDFVATIVNEDPECVGFAVNYANVQDTVVAASRVRTCLPGAVLLAGGPYATFHVEHLLQSTPAFDAVVLGEGEVPMLSLAATGTRSSTRFFLPGLVWRDRLNTEALPAPPSLTDLAPPDRRPAALLGRFARGSALASVESSRGCSHACRFCSIAAVEDLASARLRRLRNVETTAAEMAALNQLYGLRDFWFMDADFLGSPAEGARILKLAELIGGIGAVSIEIDTRADSIREDIIHALRQAGLKRAFLGVESFDDETLRMLGKHSTSGENLRAIEILEKEGVRPILGTILFHPNSTPGQLRREHRVLSTIGYHKTQGLFRLKKYRGTRDAGDRYDGAGRGISPDEDYGWEFSDDQVGMIWRLFDHGRLRLMDAVFADLGPMFRQGTIGVDAFQSCMDDIYRGLSGCMDLALEWGGSSAANLGDSSSVASRVDRFTASVIQSAFSRSILPLAND